jgi:membrane fusion protein (multidrug efflux system)
MNTVQNAGSPLRSNGSSTSSGDEGALSPEVLAPARKTRGWRIMIAVGILAATAGGTLLYWYSFMRGIVFSDDARLSGHLVDLAPEIGGRLVDVLVEEGGFIHHGQEVFRLDPSAQQAAVAQARAALASGRANLAVSQAKCERAVNGSRPEEIKAGHATVKRLQNEEDLARVEMQRTEQLNVRGVAAQDELDRARSSYESARQSRENAAQNLAMLQLGSRKEDIDAARADVQLAESRIAEAQAALDRARSDLERCTVRAPFDGYAVRRWLDPGAMPLPGQPVVSLFDPATLRVDANIEEKHLHRVAIGDEVDIHVDAYPDLSLKGRVVEILRATNSQFSLIPAEGVSGTFIKVTQRVPLRIAVQAPAGVRLGPGLSVEVKINTHTGAASRSGGFASE